MSGNKKVVELPTLYDKMLNAATETVSDINVDFGQQPTNIEGTKLYQYSGETSGTGDNQIYYYRGPVTNNNVIFAGYCWKIVRTTETGGIKLLYSGKPTNGQCLATGTEQFAFNSVFNTNTDNKKYVGYMYGEDDKYENVEPSTIKKNIEAWFEGKTTSEMTKPTGINSLEFTDLTKYEENYLEDVVWCNDRTEGKTSGVLSLYAGKERNTTYSEEIIPSLACPSNDSFTVSSENGNGKSKHKVGLITADELTMGGMVWGSSDDPPVDTYLYIGVRGWWWTMTPAHWNVSVSSSLEFHGGHVLNNASVYQVYTDRYGARPMVSLKHGIMVSGGTGIASDPYVVA